MDEGAGGFPHNDTNYIYKSTDGGNTWTNTYTGASFPGPGVVDCAGTYFACMFPDFPGHPGIGYWRYEGWGQPAAINNFVHLVYAQQGTGSDPSDVYYIRSTDGGVTFSAPLKLNTDGGTRPQWQPNLSVGPNGTLFATWYDARDSTNSDCAYGNPASPCYRMYSRKSDDNGATWLPDDTLSDVVSPLPAQPDPNIFYAYAGDYDYGSAILTKHVTSWTDGRVAINNILGTPTSQQDAFTDRELVGFHVSTTDPACGSFVSGTAPTVFTVNLSDPADPTTVQPTDFTVNGTAANTAQLSNGNQTITFTFNNTPVVNQGPQTMHIDAGAINRASDGQGIFEFNCMFRYGTTQLQVTTTNPPVGGTFTGPGSLPYDVNFNMPVDPTSVQDYDLTLSGVPGTVTGHSVSPDNMTVTWTINFPSVYSGTLTAGIAARAIADQFGNPNAAFSGAYNYVASVCDSGLIQNEGFETGHFNGWTTGGENTPVVSTNEAHSGTYSAFAGDSVDGYCGFPGTEGAGDSIFYQQFTVPASGGTFLSFWYWTCTTDNINFDWQDAYITDTNGAILQTIFHQCTDYEVWAHQTVDMTVYAGQTVRVEFLVHDDNSGDLTGMYVDDVVLYVTCAPTPTPRHTPTPRPRPTPHPRP
jgi:hypothetical protein